MGQTTYGYDAHGRVQYLTDARNGTVTNYYNQADQITNLTTQAAVGTQGAQTTSIEYDAMRRAITIDYPNQMSVYNEYYSTSQLMQQTGSVTYPSYYTYDAQGRVTSMETWQGYSFGNPIGSATTFWNFSPQRGWLVSKTYTNGTANSFTYTPGERLKTRTWARGIVSTNVYGFDDGVSGNESGELVQVGYSDGTPAITTQYDRRGRPQTVIRNGITTTLTYNDAGQLLGEAYAGGILNGLSVTNGLDNCLRRTSLDVRSTSLLTSQAYSYDSQSGRLQTVSDGVNAATVRILDFSEATKPREQERGHSCPPPSTGQAQADKNVRAPKNPRCARRHLFLCCQFNPDQPD